MDEWLAGRTAPPVVVHELSQAFALAVPHPETARIRDDVSLFQHVVRSNVTIDWTQRKSVRANLRRRVRRVLRKHGYLANKQESATWTVLEQAAALSAGWAA